MSLSDKAGAVRSKYDLAELLEDLRGDLLAHPDRWSNGDLDSFLEAITAWLRDSDGYYANRGEVPASASPWRVVADMMLAGRTYE